MIHGTCIEISHLILLGDQNLKYHKKVQNIINFSDETGEEIFIILLLFT